jgi:hypothetical protein
MKNLLSRIPLYFWVVTLFILIQIPLSSRNSLFMDEGTYITAGVRLITTLRNEHWGSWFSGSPYIAPVMYGAGYILADDLGARMVAALFVGLAILFVAKATEIYFGRGVATCAAILLAINPNVLFLGHHAVYDAVSVGFIGIAFWSIAKLYWTDERNYLYLASSLMALAALTKFAFGVMAIPLMALIILLRGRKALTDILLFAGIAYALIAYIYFPLVGNEMIEGFTKTAMMHTPSSDVAGVALLHLRMAIVPALMALIGLTLVWLYRRDMFLVALVLVGTLAMWPAYHLFRMITVSQNKHVVLGFLFSSPVAGMALYYLWKKLKISAVVAVVFIATLSYNDLQGLDRFWFDMRSTTQTMRSIIRPNDLVFTAFGDREMVPPLLLSGHITSPWIFHSKFTPQKMPSACTYSVLVLDRPSLTFEGKKYMSKDLAQCGFTLAYEEKQIRNGLSGLGVTSWESSVLIYVKNR